MENIPYFLRGRTFIIVLIIFFENLNFIVYFSTMNKREFLWTRLILLPKDLEVKFCLEHE